jgi:hypothetical protein
MAMFSFSNTILSMSTWTRQLCKGTLEGQKLAKSSRQIFTPRVSTKNFNRSRKLCANHSNKRLINGTQLWMMFHKINPYIAWIIINKSDIIFVATLCRKRCRTPYIWMNKIKRSSRMENTRRIWKLYLFAKFTTLTMKARLNRCMT